MNLYEEIIKTLKEEYASGKTYDEMAKKYSVSLSYLRELMNGKKPVKRISLEFFLRLFPEANIQFRQSTISSVVNIGHNEGTMAAVIQNDPSDKILNSTELSAEEKVKILKVLKK